MKDKRILICCNRTLNLGGIEKALTTFLRAFDTKKNDVILVLHDSKGVLHAELPLEDIAVFYTDSLKAANYLKDDLKNLRVGELIKGVWNRLMLRLDNNWYARIMYTYRIIQRGLVFPGHFDCAISFTSDYSDLSMVAAADADKRISFVHGDATQGKRAARLNDHLVCKMDRIYSVSERAGELFQEVHPGCKGKVDVLHNVILPEEIRKKAEEPAAEMLNDGKLTICTVGRLSSEKGQQMIPETAQLLRAAGRDFRWYLVGEGGLRVQLEQEITKRNLQEHVILLGGKANPYPYMKNCDIYVQTSLSEAYCITVAEARILCRPIVTTDAPGLREQITGGENGIILGSMSPDALFEGIQKLAADPLLQQAFSEKLKSVQCLEEHPLRKLYDYIEDKESMDVKL